MERLEVIQTELQIFLNSSAYSVLVEALNGRSTLLDREVIDVRPTSLADILNREAAIGEARAAVTQLNFLQDFADEVTATLKEKHAPSE